MKALLAFESALIQHLGNGFVGVFQQFHGPLHPTGIDIAADGAAKALMEQVIEHGFENAVLNYGLFVGCNTLVVKVSLHRAALSHRIVGDVNYICGDLLILLAGKGHEKYEITADGRHPFDEEQIVLEAVRNKNLS